MAYQYLLSHGNHNVLKGKQDKSMIPHASIYIYTTTKKLEEGEGD